MTIRNELSLEKIARVGAILGGATFSMPIIMSSLGYQCSNPKQAIYVAGAGALVALSSALTLLLRSNRNYSP